MDTHERVTRNTVEIVTEEELRSLLGQTQKKVYAGYEPSGEIHLGHLVTACTPAIPTDYPEPGNTKYG
jgi:tyrosyl-tRNA synthetase